MYISGANSPGRIIESIIMVDVFDDDASFYEVLVFQFLISMITYITFLC